MAIKATRSAIDQENKKKSLLDEVRKECGDDLNKNISDALIEIEKNNKNYRYGFIYEASFKNGGMNLWYSNEYQYELISEFVYNKSSKYIWERFHVPYWKLRFLRRVHRSLAVPLQFIYIIIIITLSIPLCFISLAF